MNDDSTKEKSPSREILVTIWFEGHGSVALAGVKTVEPIPISTEPSNVVPPSLEDMDEKQDIWGSRVDATVERASEIASKIVPSVQDFLDKCKTVCECLAIVVSAVDSIPEVCFNWMLFLKLT